MKSSSLTGSSVTRKPRRSSEVSWIGLRLAPEERRSYSKLIQRNHDCAVSGTIETVVCIEDNCCNTPSVYYTRKCSSDNNSNKDSHRRDQVICLARTSNGVRAINLRIIQEGEVVGRVFRLCVIKSEASAPPIWFIVPRFWGARFCCKCHCECFVSITPS